MKPQLNQKKPLQGRNRGLNNNQSNNNNNTPVDPNKPAVPRMLRRMTRQSFMDVDLQYLLRCDPSTPDPFENSSPILSDPPSLFRPLPPVAAAAQAIAQGAAPWSFHEAARLQKEQEDLRVQYLQFLHQLHLANPHGFLAHMNTFATEYPQEFLQLQSYIKFQEQQAHQRQVEQRHKEELVQYQMELERRNKAEQDLRQFQEFQELQHQKEEQKRQEELLQSWLIRRQQTRASYKKEMDLADLFTLAFQRDRQLVGKVTSSPGGIDMVLTPQQQFEFGQFLQANQMEEEKKRKEALLLESFGLHQSSSTASGFGGGVGGGGLFGGMGYNSSWSGVNSSLGGGLFSGGGGGFSKVNEAVTLEANDGLRRSSRNQNRATPRYR
ncbi:hypothetical protein BG015_009965 [Linnemannia schmuckeri]|uniref:Uncharacterized protein n=1 Tax=Linnemannia schmuckeri TaxID=64567 RepID=A0A9P5S8S2_9FUNG|nr:hypothetical protein BG015_009965 [Linnemannia schmuckeri]